MLIRMNDLLDSEEVKAKDAEPENLGRVIVD